MRIHPRSLVFSLLFGAAVAGCVTAADESPELGEDVSELSVWQWPDDTQIQVQDTTRQVGLAGYNDFLYMVYTDNAATNLKWSRYNGSTWSGETSLWQNSDSTPALAEHADRLHLVFKPAGEGRLMKMDMGGSTWTSPVTVGRSLGSYSPYAPSAMSYGGKLYLAYCVINSNGATKVFVDRLDGTTWSAIHEVTTSTTNAFACKSALLAPMPDTGEVELIYNVVNTTGSQYSAVMRKRFVIGRSTTVIYSAEVLPMKSMKALSVVTCDGNTHLVHGGYSSVNEIWWSFRDGGDWVADIRVPNQSSGAGATLGCFDGVETFLVHNVSNGTDLMQSVFGP